MAIIAIYSVASRRHVYLKKIFLEAEGKTEGNQFSKVKPFSKKALFWVVSAI